MGIHTRRISTSQSPIKPSFNIPDGTTKDNSSNPSSHTPIPSSSSSSSSTSSSQMLPPSSNMSLGSLPLPPSNLGMGFTFGGGMIGSSHSSNGGLSAGGGRMFDMRSESTISDPSTPLPLPPLPQSYTFPTFPTSTSSRTPTPTQTTLPTYPSSTQQGQKRPRSAVDDGHGHHSHSYSSSFDDTTSIASSEDFGESGEWIGNNNTNNNSSGGATSGDAGIGKEEESWGEDEDGLLQSFLANPLQPLSNPYPPHTLPDPPALDELTNQVIYYHSEEYQSRLDAREKEGKEERSRRRGRKSLISGKVQGGGIRLSSLDSERRRVSSGSLTPTKSDLSRTSSSSTITPTSTPSSISTSTTPTSSHSQNHGHSRKQPWNHSWHSTRKRIARIARLESRGLSMDELSLALGHGSCSASSTNQVEGGGEGVVGGIGGGNGLSTLMEGVESSEENNQLNPKTRLDEKLDGLGNGNGFIMKSRVGVMSRPGRPGVRRVSSMDFLDQAVEEDLRGSRTEVGGGEDGVDLEGGMDVEVGGKTFGNGSGKDVEGGLGRVLRLSTSLQNTSKMPTLPTTIITPPSNSSSSSRQSQPFRTPALPGSSSGLSPPQFGMTTRSSGSPTASNNGQQQPRSTSSSSSSRSMRRHTATKNIHSSGSRPTSLLQRGKSFTATDLARDEALRYALTHKRVDNTEEEGMDIDAVVREEKEESSSTAIGTPNDPNAFITPVKKGGSFTTIQISPDVTPTSSDVALSSPLAGKYNNTGVESISGGVKIGKSSFLAAPLFSSPIDEEPSSSSTSGPSSLTTPGSRNGSSPLNDPSTNFYPFLPPTPLAVRALAESTGTGPSSSPRMTRSLSSTTTAALAHTPYGLQSAFIAPNQPSSSNPSELLAPFSISSAKKDKSQGQASRRSNNNNNSDNTSDDDVEMDGGRVKAPERKKIRRLGSGFRMQPSAATGMGATEEGSTEQGGVARLASPFGG